MQRRSGEKTSHIQTIITKGIKFSPLQTGSSDPRTWELAAPTIDSTSSWLLSRSTAIGWLSEEDTMSFRH